MVEEVFTEFLTHLTRGYTLYGVLALTNVRFRFILLALGYF